MQIDHLVTEETVEDVMDALDSLSSNVNDYYQKSIERIERMSSNRDQNIIKMMLKWVYYAKRPLKVDEMYHILAIKPGNNSATRLQRNVESNKELGLKNFIDRSAGLLTIREESQIVSVAHPTVQEYLKTLEATLLSTAGEEISERCLTYLFLDVFADGLCTLQEPFLYRLSEFPFVVYASTFWGDHLWGKPEENAALQDLALDFLKNEQVLYSSVQVRLSLTDALVGIRNLQREVPGIVVAAMFGLVLLVNRLLEDGADIERRGRDGETALYQASLKGHKPVVKLLLEKGADINAQGADHNNALQAASAGGHLGIIRMLLDQGANVNAKGPFPSYDNFFSALHAASGAGYTAAVKLLLDNGADINALCNGHSNALHAASVKGHIGVVELLLQNKDPKVNVNLGAMHNYYYDSLYSASAGGHEAIARLLIENGADVHANHAIQAAAYMGQMGTVKLLLQNGADIHAQGRPSNNALQAAAEGGHEAIVTLLLEKGADVNAQGCKNVDFGNALQAACFSGNEAIVRLLLKKGAKVNARNEAVGCLHVSALQTASSYGRLMVMQLLLEEGAEVNAEGGSEYNALWAAAVAGHEDAVRLLLEWGAIANWDEERWVSLWAARRRVSDATMELIKSYPRLGA